VLIVAMVLAASEPTQGSSVGEKEKIERTWRSISVAVARPIGAQRA